jgi:hypothetical protein
MSNVHELVRDAQVEVRVGKDKKNQDCAVIAVNDQYEHMFPYTSRVSRHLDIMTPTDLQTRLSGGTFFFIEDTLIDWRDGMYNGFVHTDNTVDEYMSLLGYQHTKDLALVHRRKETTPILLRSVWDKNEIIVPNYATGGKFTSELSFVWNPFVTSINSSFDLVRLICTNGMVGLTSFLNTKIPLLNRQTEHLDIAARQIQHKVSNIIQSRIQYMADDRASVGQCLLLENHVIERLSSTVASSEHTRLLGLLNAISPSANLSDVYRDSVFDDKNLSAQLPGHLSAFDVFNVATELRTHTTETKNSSDFSLDKFANDILFDDTDHKVNTYNNRTALASFSSPDNAFFGTMVA